MEELNIALEIIATEWDIYRNDLGYVPPHLLKQELDRQFFSDDGLSSRFFNNRRVNPEELPAMAEKVNILYENIKDSYGMR